MNLQRGAIRAVLIGPAVLLVVGFVLVPTLMAAIDSFNSEGEWTLGNYPAFATVPPYPQVLLNTLVIALYVTVISLLIAAPAAAFIARRQGRSASIVLGLIGSSLWISILVKVYSWQVLLAKSGPINALLVDIGATGQPLPLLYTRGAVLIAMIQFMAPYACILLVAGMRKVDWELVVAARTLGARLPKVVSDVYWPQVRFSFVMTGLIVFVISSSFFVAPALLGGPGETMLGIQMKSDLVNRYDSGMAATTGTALTIILLIVAWIALKLSGGSFRRVAEEVAR
jgi:putative spermidine/putrescine transport system permease protein